jgi:diadenosine tetraphosphate (Ap4A) HIT family hydrolase
MACDLCAVLDPRALEGPLDRHLRPGQPRWIAGNDHATAIPTIGAYLAGYILIVPRPHVLSLGQLDEDTRRGVEQLTEQMADRVAQVYGTTVLGFEYGLNQSQARRIDHAHLHLLPSRADLRGWLSRRLDGYEVDSMTELPSTSQYSYITVWHPQTRLTVYPVPNDASPRIRLREVVAALDGRVDVNSWDWQGFPCGQLMRQTVDDLVQPVARVHAAVSAASETR